MSTRTQIRFVSEDGDRVAQVYNHSDGYPSSIVEELAKLEELLTDSGWHRGPEYAAAQYIFVRKMRGLRYYADRLGKFMDSEEVEEGVSDRLKEVLEEQDGIGPQKADAAARMAVAMTTPEVWGKLERQPYFLGGHGVEQGNIHGDEEYIYEVTVKGGNWDVKVSEKKWDGGFESPLWEGRDDVERGYDYDEGETAWDIATWMYEGGLSDAYELLQQAEEDYEDMFKDDEDTYVGDLIHLYLRDGKASYEDEPVAE